MDSTTSECDTSTTTETTRYEPTTSTTETTRYEPTTTTTETTRYEPTTTTVVPETTTTADDLWCWEETGFSKISRSSIYIYKVV